MIKKYGQLTLVTRLGHALITVLVIVGATSSLVVLARALQALQHVVPAGMLPRGLKSKGVGGLLMCTSLGRPLPPSFFIVFLIRW